MAGVLRPVLTRKAVAGTRDAEEMPVGEMNNIRYNVLILGGCSYLYEIVWQARSTTGKNTLRPSLRALQASSASSYSSPMLGIELRDVLDNCPTIELHLSPTDMDSSISLPGPECQDSHNLAMRLWAGNLPLCLI